MTHLIISCLVVLYMVLIHILALSFTYLVVYGTCAMKYRLMCSSGLSHFPCKNWGKIPLLYLTILYLSIACYRLLSWGVPTIIWMECGVLSEWGNECRDGIRDGMGKGQGQSYTGIWEVWRECWRCRVESMECSGWVMEDGSIGVRTWLQLMCCALTKEQGCP